MNIKLIKALQDSGKLFFITATGGGTSFVGEFLKVPGGSKCIIGGHIPYATEATDKFVGEKLNKYSDEFAARRLAVASFEYCTKMNFPADKCIGVGVTASLVKDNERDGRKHYINVAIHTNNTTAVTSVELSNSPYNRLAEEELTNAIILNQLIQECIINVDGFRTDEILAETKNHAELIQIAISDIGFLQITEGYNFMKDLTVFANVPIDQNKPLVIYPGSFNPLHDGHKDIYNMAKEITGLPVFYELTTVHSFKPAIDFLDLRNRRNQFRTNENIIFTKAPRFVDKVNLLKKTYNPTEIIIVVGADTWEKVYDETAHKNGDIKFFEDNNVKFLVFGRNVEIKNQDSKLFIKHHVALGYSKVISSSEIRKQIQTLKNVE